MGKIIAFILFVIVSFSACGGASESGVKSNTNQNNQNKTASESKLGDSFISKDYSDNNELYAFIKSYLDYKKPAMENLEAKKGEFKDTVALLATGDWAIDLPIKPLVNLQGLEKSGDSWNGTVSVYNYEITKSGDIYSFKFTSTVMDEVTEGKCDVKIGTLQITIRNKYATQKYQVTALAEGAYLRFWSEKSDILEETRAHYTYFKGNDAAVGQEETTSPKELIGSNFKDDTYAENDEGWVKYIGGKASNFDGMNS
jgi:hypothetical protein